MSTSVTTADRTLDITEIPTGVRITYTAAHSTPLVYEMSTGAFAQAMRLWHKNTRVPSGIMTNGRVLFRTNSTRIPCWIFEREPEWTVVEYIPTSRHVALTGRGEGRASTHRIFLPYTIWYVDPYHCRTQLAFSSQPITDWDQPLYLPPLPNIFSTATLCLGNANMPEQGTGKERLAWAYQAFFEQRFNNDLTETLRDAYEQNRLSALICPDDLDRDSDDLDDIGEWDWSDMFSRWEALSEAEVLALDWPYIARVSAQPCTFRHWVDQANGPESTDSLSLPHINRLTYALHCHLHRFSMS